jgi:hypothetical protein
MEHERDEPDNIQVGDRVKLVPERAQGFIQPWRGRFERGRAGTVLSGPAANIRGFWVEWDHGKTKYPSAWRMDMEPDDLVVVARPCQRNPRSVNMTRRSC